MGDESDIIDLTNSETFHFSYLGADGESSNVAQTYKDCPNLAQAAELFRRFLLSAGYSAKEVVIDTGISKFSSEYAY